MRADRARSAVLACGLGLCCAGVPAAAAPRAVVRSDLSAGGVGVMLNMRSGMSSAPVTGSLYVDAPAGGPVRVTGMHLEFGPTAVSVPVFPGGATTVSVTALSVDLGAAGLTLAASPDAGGGMTLGAGQCAATPAGSVTYAVFGSACPPFTSAGMACAATIGLGTTTLTVASGSVQGSRVTLALEAVSALPPAATSWGSARAFATLVADIEPGPSCLADFNGSGGPDLLDIFGFLNAWFAGDARADVGGVAGVELLDIFVFLGAWFAGCP